MDAKCETAGHKAFSGLVVCGRDAGHDPDDGHYDTEKQVWFFIRD